MCALLSVFLLLQICVTWYSNDEFLALLYWGAHLSLPGVPMYPRLRATPSFLHSCICGHSLVWEAVCEWLLLLSSFSESVRLPRCSSSLRILNADLGVQSISHVVKMCDMRASLLLFYPSVFLFLVFLSCNSWVLVKLYFKVLTLTFCWPDQEESRHFYFWSDMCTVPTLAIWQMLLPISIPSLPWPCFLSQSLSSRLFLHAHTFHLTSIFSIFSVTLFLFVSPLSSLWLCLLVSTSSLPPSLFQMLTRPQISHTRSHAHTEQKSCTFWRGYRRSNIRMPPWFPCSALVSRHFCFLAFLLIIDARHDFEDFGISKISMRNFRHQTSCFVWYRVLKTGIIFAGYWLDDTDLITWWISQMLCIRTLASICCTHCSAIGTDHNDQHMTISYCAWVCSTAGSFFL